MAIYLILLLIYSASHLTSVQTQIRIPDFLKECYINNATKSHLPMNIRVLIDIIRKVEIYSKTAMDLRTMSSSLLHRFKFDGIEYIEGMKEIDGVLPFTGTGSQRLKHKLIEELVPGNAQLFPTEVLTLEERCTLHHAISNAISKHNFENRNTACSLEQTERITGRAVVAGSQNCSEEYGVIFTPYGTIAPGAVIAAVAACLQRQDIAIKELLMTTDTRQTDKNITKKENAENLNYNEDEVDLILPKHQMLLEKSMWLLSLIPSSVKLDNVWLTTIAGDLAELVVYQGPILGLQMTLGATGFWNNTMRPNTYYLMNKYKYFDATRAEIIGDIDGFIIASKLQTWMERFQSLRLSQILDMYYSDKGAVFDANVRACDRGKIFSQIAPNTILEEQIYAVSQILAYRKSIAYVSDKALKSMIDRAVDLFSTYTKDYLFTEARCRNEKRTPYIEALVAFDGAWSKEYTIDFMAVLIEDLDVSRYGSRMGIIHGLTGEWLLNVTNSPSVAYNTIPNLMEIPWPTNFNCIKVLQTVFVYLNETWEERQKNYTIGNIGQAVVLLIPLAHLNEEEQQSALMLLKQIKHHHPDVHFLYYTSEQNANIFKSFILSEEDHLIRNLRIDDISRHLLNVPRMLRPVRLFDISIPTDNQDHMEDYIYPPQIVTYRLHPHWKIKTKKITVTIHTFGYGTLRVCSWNQNKINGPEEGFYCQEITGHREISFTDYSICTNELSCQNTYYRIQDVTSLQKCTELDCKSPDGVRYIIRIQKIYHRNSTSKTIGQTTSLMLCLSFLILFNAYQKLYILNS